MKGIASVKKSGFTLIELVVVIVILGILAATVAPKFIDLTGDAQAAIVKNISGSLNTGIQFAVLKDKIEGGNGDPLEYNDGTITFRGGLPRTSAGEMRFLLDMDLPTSTFTSNWSTVPCEGSEFCIVGNRPFTDNTLPSISEFTSGTGVFFWPEGYVLEDCFAYYLNLGDGSDIENSDPIVGYVVSGC